MTTEFLLEDVSFKIKVIRGDQRKPVLAFAVFQVPTTQNNQYIKVAYFGGAYSTILQPFVNLLISLPSKSHILLNIYCL